VSAVVEGVLRLDEDFDETHVEHDAGAEAKRSGQDLAVGELHQGGDEHYRRADGGGKPRPDNQRERDPDVLVRLHHRCSLLLLVVVGVCCELELTMNLNCRGRRPE